MNAAAAVSAVVVVASTACPKSASNDTIFERRLEISRRSNNDSDSRPCFWNKKKLPYLLYESPLGNYFSTPLGKRRLLE